MKLISLLKFKLAFASFTLILQLSATSGTPSEHTYCQDLKPQNGVDIEQIMGMWYGVELLDHIRGDPGEYSYNTCPVIHLSETTHEVYSTTDRNNPYHMSFDPYHEHKYRHLHLIWDEGSTIDYTLKFNNTRKGFWVSSGPQNGEIYGGPHNINIGSQLPPQYNSFAGTVQVLKAVGNHMVLTFCQRLPDSQLFSIILSRTPNDVTKEDIFSLHGLFHYRHLSTTSVKRVCRNGSGVTSASLGQVLSAVIICVIGFLTI